MMFTGKTALITGAASGMGLLFAQCYAEQGGNVVMTDINPETLAKCVEEINQKGMRKAIGVVCDVRDYAQVCKVRDMAVETFGSIDLLVNFAGGAETRMLGVSGEFPDIPIEVYDWGIDVNLKGQFYFNHAVMKQMREQKSGVIINIGSITGEEGCASLERAAEPQEIVDMVLFLASEKGAFATGVNVLLDGGRNVIARN